MKINKLIVGFLSFLFFVSCFSSCSSPTSTSIQVGEPTTVKDFKLTLLDTESTAFVDGYEPAPYGEEFFFVAFEAENVSNKEKTLSSSDFKFYVNNEEVSKTSFLTYKYLDLDSLYLSQTVAAGRKTSFYLVAQIPENCDSVELTYQDSHTFNIAHTPVTSSQETLSSSKNTDSTDSSSPNTPPVFSLGETFSNSAFDITLLQGIQTDYVDKYGSFYYSPDDGKHFVIFILDVKNTSAQTMRFNYLSYFDAYVDDYAAKFTDFLGTDFNGYDALNDLDYTDMLPGKAITGYCVLEVPDGWSTIELSARNGSFVISPNDVEIQ